MRALQVKLATGAGTIQTWELFWIAKKNLPTLEKAVNARMKAKSFAADFKVTPLPGKQRADGAFSSDRNVTWRVLVNTAEVNAGCAG